MRAFSKLSRLSHDFFMKNVTVLLWWLLAEVGPSHCFVSLCPQVPSQVPSQDRQVPSQVASPTLWVSSPFNNKVNFNDPTPGKFNGHSSSSSTDRKEKVTGGYL